MSDSVSKPKPQTKADIEAELQNVRNQELMLAAALMTGSIASQANTDAERVRLAILVFGNVIGNVAKPGHVALMVPKMVPEIVEHAEFVQRGRAAIEALINRVEDEDEDGE